MLEDIIEARGYAEVKAMIDAADTPEARKRLPKDGMFPLVIEIEADLVALWKREHEEP